MMQKAWSSIEEVPFCFSRSSVKFQGHIAQNIVDFDPNWGRTGFKINDLNPIWVRLLGQSQLLNPSDLPCLGWVGWVGGGGGGGVCVCVCVWGGGGGGGGGGSN